MKVHYNCSFLWNKKNWKLIIILDLDIKIFKWNWAKPLWNNIDKEQKNGQSKKLKAIDKNWHDL